MGNPSPLYGLVLLGGKSTRMKRDKASLEYHGKNQSLYAYELLVPFCEKVFFSIRPGQANLESVEGYPHIYDLGPYTDIGPLGGILSALTQIPETAWLVLACDLPFMDAATLKNLLPGPS